MTIKQLKQQKSFLIDSEEKTITLGTDEED